MVKKNVSSAEETVRIIYRKKRREHSGEQKIRIDVEGLRRELDSKSDPYDAGVCGPCCHVAEKADYDFGVYRRII